MPKTVRDRFAAQARAAGLSVAALVRTFVEQVAGEASASAPSGGSAHKLNLRLRDEARARLRQEAAAHGSTPAAWATAMLEAQLLGKPRWSRDELAELRAMRVAIARIRDDVTAPAAADRIEAVVQGIDAAITGNLAYWGARERPCPTRSPTRS